MSYSASYNFTGKANLSISELSLMHAIDGAVSDYIWILTAMAGHQIQMNVSRLCMGSRAGWEHFRDAAGEHLASVRILAKDGQEYLSFTDAEKAGADIIGVAIERGDTLMKFRYEIPEVLHCTLTNPRFTVETGSVAAFFPAIEAAMYREYLRLMCECGQPECTNIGL